jgi:hypothetical protein
MHANNLSLSNSGSDMSPYRFRRRTTIRTASSSVRNGIVQLRKHWRYLCSSHLRLLRASIPVDGISASRRRLWKLRVQP